MFDPRPDPPVDVIVDRLDMHTGGGMWRWRVTARTAPWWHRQLRRVYHIDAASDNLAAQEGMRRLVEEAKAPKIVLST